MVYGRYLAACYVVIACSVWVHGSVQHARELPVESQLKVEVPARRNTAALAPHGILTRGSIDGASVLEAQCEDAARTITQLGQRRPPAYVSDPDLPVAIPDAQTTPSILALSSKAWSVLPRALTASATPAEPASPSLTLTTSSTVSATSSESTTELTEVSSPATTSATSTPVVSASPDDSTSDSEKAQALAVRKRTRAPSSSSSSSSQC
ncbi:hypothetical protein OH77DRAFT_184670 [Trametes cingulata]|nr:hypothetical protein OH77DRAFT_184670 [Trametes cingulata]